MHRLLVYAGAGALIAVAGLRSTYLSRAVPAVGSSVAEPPTKVNRERGLSFLPKSYHHNFAHELMVAQITASVELGTRESPNIRLITWPETWSTSARRSKRAPIASGPERPSTAAAL
jgi:hypothetical protein